jgi:hypothetical protein
VLNYTLYHHTVMNAYPETLEALVRDVKIYCEDCGEHLKMIVWGVEEVV